MNFRALKIVLTCVAFTLSVSVGSAGVAVGNPADSAAVALPDLVVSAPTEADRDLVPAQRLGGERLEQLSAHSVADAIRYFSGAQIKDYGGVGGVKTVDVRSMGSAHLGVFYDGVELGNAQNGQVDLGKYSLDNIEAVTLYNGEKSRIFQSAKDFSSASAVYLETRRPQFAAGRNYALRAVFRTGSFGLVNPSLRVDFRLSDRVSASVNAEYTYANGRYRFRYRRVFPDGTVAWDTTATRRNGDIHALRLEAALFGRTDRGRWDAKVYFYDGVKGIPGAIVNNVWKNSQRQWDRNFFAQGAWRHSFSERVDFMAKGKFAHDRLRYLNPDTTLMYTDNRFAQNEAYLSATGRVRITDFWEASLAADWQWNTLSSTLAEFVRPQRHTLFTALATAAEWRGLRAQASILLTSALDRLHPSGKPVSTSRLSRWSPSFTLSWRPETYAPLELHAFAKRSFRLPTFNDLYYTDIGNASLRPESADQYSVGTSWGRELSAAVPLLRFGAEFYHNRVRDKIIAVPKGNSQYRWMMMNIGRVRITGLDLSADLSLDFGRGWSAGGRLTYTLQKALDYTDPSDNEDAAGTYRGQIAYIPVHSGSATANVGWRSWSLNYAWIYVGERWHNSSNIPANHEQPWYTHDLSLYWVTPLRPEAGTLRVGLEINNLFNQQYEVIQNYPMPGRNFKLLLTYTY